MATLVRQSFDIFNVYGKTPEAMANVVLGFSVALETNDAVDIQAAFKNWLKESAVMPTPADIKKLADENKNFRMVQAGRSSAAPTVNKPRAPDENQNFPRFPWVYKNYQDALEDGSVQAFFNHWAAVPNPEHREAGYEWLRYACDFLEYPRHILRKFRNAMGLADLEQSGI